VTGSLETSGVLRKVTTGPRRRLRSRCVTIQRGSQADNGVRFPSPARGRIAAGTVTVRRRPATSAHRGHAPFPAAPQTPAEHGPCRPPSRCPFVEGAVSSPSEGHRRVATGINVRYRGGTVSASANAWSTVSTGRSKGFLESAGSGNRLSDFRRVTPCLHPTDHTVGSQRRARARPSMPDTPGC
jgi:hypothetical protein